MSITTIEEMRNDYDWKEAFGFASFGMDDVAEILTEDAGYNDGDSWECVGRLKDGRYFFLSAWCDYTGWYCQSGGECEIRDTYDELVRWGMGDTQRKRLGIPQPEANQSPDDSRGSE